MKILYFAWVREQIGTEAEELAVPSEILDIAGLVTWLAQRSAGHRAALSEVGRLRAAIDDRFARFDESIAGAREIALFPPVTGG